MLIQESIGLDEGPLQSTFIFVNPGEYWVRRGFTTFVNPGEYWV